MRRDLNLHGSIIPFQIPYSTLKYRVNITKTQKAISDEIETKFAGHPTVFSVG